MRAQVDLGHGWRAVASRVGGILKTRDLGGAESIVRFGIFEVDLCARQLRKNGVRIHLQEQPFSVLVALLGRPGEPVTREQLRRSIWPEACFGDFDHGLNKAVSKLRLALADSASTPRFIETLPKRGYRFLAPLVSAGLLRNDGRLRLAVMPFRTSVADDVDEQIADGLTEELITTFTKADSKRLAVISRTSVHFFAAKGIRQISSELHADYVVEGLVRSSDQRIRVSVQLIKAHDEAHVWAEIFDRPLDDVFAVQDELAKLITQAVIAAVLGEGETAGEPLSKGGCCLSA